MPGPACPREGRDDSRPVSRPASPIPIASLPRLPDGASGHEQASASPLPSPWSPRSSPWLVAAGALCLTTPTYGLMSAWGLFQVYWEGHQLAGGQASPPPSSAIAWTGSLFGFLSCLFGLASGLFLDDDDNDDDDDDDDDDDRRRRRPPFAAVLALACAVYWAAFLALGWATTFAQLMACVVVAGVSSAVPTTAAFVVVDRVFARAKAAHKPLAVGLVSAGAPLGGLLASLALRALFAQHSWRGAMLWLSSAVGLLVLAGCVLVAWGERRPRRRHGPRSRPRPRPRPHSPRRPPTHRPTRAPAAWRDLSHFANRSFVLFTAAVFVFEFVLFTQWGSLPVFAALTGVGDVFYLQMTYNLGAIPGRTVPSWLVARWDAFSVTLAMTAATIVTVFAVWVPFGDRSAPALYLVAFLMGTGTGSFVPLSATGLSLLCNGRGYGKWLGSCYAVVGFASLAANPVNQALLAATGPRFSVAFQGLLLVAAFVCCAVVRRDHVRPPAASPERA